MKPRLVRALLVVGVFALLGVLSATDRKVTEASAPPPPPEPVAHSGQSAFPVATTQPDAPPAVPPAQIFISMFRYYVAWALITPGILYLARRVPMLGRHRVRALAFHAIVPVAGSVPFFCLRIMVNMAFGAETPTWTVIANIPWGRVFALETVSGVQVYWLLLGVGTVIQMTKDHAAQELRQADLQRSLAAAQLDALKFKLQPHLLFNTLNAISSLAQAGDADGAGRVVERLGTLLRLAMETSGRQLVTLDEELSVVDAYLAIEEIRFGDRLRIVRRIAPEAGRALVPNLILQPLVENALVHGLARRLDASLLEVAARCDGRVLHIAVRDDGPGLPAGWTFETHAGGGVRNVSDRIRALYPGECGFRMENGATGGAVAMLSIPFADAATTAVAEESQLWTA